MSALIVTIDGPAGSGKSTAARLLARRLGLEFLDTGAMYRGLTAHCLDRGIDPADQVEAVEALARTAAMRFDWQADPPRLHVDGGDGFTDVTDRLRDPDVTARVSIVAALPPVRAVMVKAQQQIGREHPRLVTEGRDQGSVVFPDARLKFFLDATPEVRARRRAEQLRRMSKPADEERILNALLKRDRRDVNRSDGPLICAEHAIMIDTTDLGLREVVDLLERYVKESVPDGG